jgi:DNA-binding MarR family transcriptional regulator
MEHGRDWESMTTTSAKAMTACHVTDEETDHPAQVGQDDGKKQASTLYLVKRLEQAIRSQLDELLRPMGLTTPQYTALTVLERRDGLSSAQLARRSFVKPQTMHEMVLTLEERGYIERTRDPANRRALLISLTRQGGSILRDYDERVRQLEMRMLGELEGCERTELRRVLEACTAAVSRPEE